MVKTMKTTGCPELRVAYYKILDDHIHGLELRHDSRDCSCRTCDWFDLRARIFGRLCSSRFDAADKQDGYEQHLNTNFTVC